jgi:hypothetical protein
MGVVGIKIPSNKGPARAKGDWNASNARDQIIDLAA